MNLSRDEIYYKVRQILVDSLGVEEELVSPEALLEDDLGAESLDYLDIGFHMEKAFGFSIKPDEMLLGKSPGEDFLRDGKITNAGLAELRRRMPHVCFDRLENDRDVKNLQRVFNVNTLVDFVLVKQAEQGE